MTRGSWSPPRPADAEAHAEDFLYHLSRGSELLASGRLDGAREELEQALRTRSREPGAQDLLARLYFRLGVYPRAIELYQDVVAQHPDQLAPRVNLALAYLKTGQLRDAVTQLLPVIERQPDHVRAWGYLGLAWSRMGEYAKAREAFHRAGHEGPARRMAEALDAEHAANTPRGEPAANTVAALAADEDLAGRAIDALDSGALEPGGLPLADRTRAPTLGTWTAREPGSTVAALRDGAPSVAEFVRDQALAPRGGALELDRGVLVVAAGCAARLGPDALIVGAARGAPVVTEGLAAARLVWLREGWAALPPRPGRGRVVLTLRDEALCVRPSALLAVEGALEFAALRDGIAAVVRGRGRLALEVVGEPRALGVSVAAPVELSRSALSAWSIAVTIADVPDAPTRVLARGDGVLIAAAGAIGGDDDG